MSYRYLRRRKRRENMPYFGPNRYLCDVLEDMRKCFETLNFSPLKGLIEEAQILGNRMESGLSDKRDLKSLSEERHKLKEDYKKLKKEVEELEKLKEQLQVETGVQPKKCIT